MALSSGLKCEHFSFWGQTSSCLITLFYPLVENNVFQRVSVSTRELFSVSYLMLLDGEEEEMLFQQKVTKHNQSATARFCHCQLAGIAIKCLCLFMLVFTVCIHVRVHYHKNYEYL